MKRPIIGFTIGFVGGMLDVFLLRAVGISMFIDGVDRTIFVVLFFAINFGALGAVIGSLLDSRRAIKSQSRVIADQYDELESTQRELLESRTLAAVGQLSSGVAHEVRNPLGVIRASASMIIEDAEPGSDTEDAAIFIREEVDRLSGFVTRLLDFTRPLAIERRPLDVSALFERARQMVASEVVEVSFVDDLPADFVASRVQADEDLLVALLLGLVQNASRALAEHGEAKTEGRVQVRSSAPAGSGEVFIDVRDDGPGIPAEDLERVFEPFFTTRASGTGLGLAMAKKIAAAHGATIVALPDEGLGDEGQGACLRIALSASDSRALPENNRCV